MTSDEGLTGTGTMRPPQRPGSAGGDPRAWHRFAFAAHAGGRVVLRPTGSAPADPRLPSELTPGNHLGSLHFAELATAFRGVVEVDPMTGDARIVEMMPQGAPR